MLFLFLQKSKKSPRTYQQQQQQTMSAFSIYIPSVYPNITEEMISNTFHRMEVGKVKHIELVRQNNKPSKAYVFFDTIYDTEIAKDVTETLRRGETSKLSYAKSEHVFWILLQSRRDYDGTSNVGEFYAMDFTEEEIAFMESHQPDFSLVDASYANALETEITSLRNQVAQLQMNNQIMFCNYNHAISHQNHLQDCLQKWSELARGKQGDRLCHAINSYTENGISMGNQEMTMDELKA